MVTPTSPRQQSADAARILLVEDERLVALSLTQQLQALNYKVVGHAASGAEAISKAGELHPDLVLMDIRLEGQMDGIEAAAEIQKQFDLPVIYLTAFSTPDVLDRAKVTEPLGYILKPYQDRNLQVVIEMALYRLQAERQRAVRQPAAGAEPDQRPAPPVPLAVDKQQRMSELSMREAEVMTLIVSGKSQKQIASELGISIQTTGKHRTKIFEKLGVVNDVELVRFVLSADGHSSS